MKKNRRKLIYLALLLFGLYILSGMILNKRQDKIIFHPEKLDSSFTFQFSLPFKEFHLKINKSTTLDALYLKADSAKGQVLFFHGRKGNIQTHKAAYLPFLRKGLNVFTIDYPGYGKSSGTPTEKMLNESAEVLYQLAVNYFSADSTLIYGEGLGAAVAAHLAYKEKSKKVVLVNPFYNLYEVAHHYFPIFPVKSQLHYKFPVYFYVPRIKAPVTLIYNKKGKGFFYRQAKKLSKDLNKKDQFISQTL